MSLQQRFKIVSGLWRAHARPQARGEPTARQRVLSGDALLQWCTESLLLPAEQAGGAKGDAKFWHWHCSPLHSHRHVLEALTPLFLLPPAL